MRLMSVKVLYLIHDRLFGLLVITDIVVSWWPVFFYLWRFGLL